MLQIKKTDLLIKVSCRWIVKKRCDSFKRKIVGKKNFEKKGR